MSDQPLSAAEKAQLATRIGQLDEQVAARDSTINTLQARLPNAKKKDQDGMLSQIAAAREERSAILQEANTLRAQLGMPMVIPSTTQVLPHPTVATTVPAKKKGGFMRGCLIGVGVLVVLIIGITQLGGGGSTPSTAATGGAAGGSAAQPTIALPADQAAFIQIVEPFYQQYKDAPNELKGSALRTQRKEALAKQLTSMKITNWAGTLQSLDTNSEGKAAIVIKLDGSDIEVGTWNNAISDIGSETLIANSSPLYNTLSDLARGDHVVFSGEFLPSEKDHITEQSVTESGSMTSPRFLVRFSDVAKK